ncbi:MAG: aspartyl protease family protein [Pseudomonadota bacterium]
MVAAKTPLKSIRGTANAATGTLAALRRSQSCRKASASHRCASNGVEGRFVINTGASVVSVDRAAAERAALEADQEREVIMQTANGAATATMNSIKQVALGAAAAENVAAAVVLSAPIGEDIDGRLGMSFLARFTVDGDARRICISAREK